MKMLIAVLLVKMCSSAVELKVFTGAVSERFGLGSADNTNQSSWEFKRESSSATPQRIASICDLSWTISLGK
jgi:hypothetical protein